MLQPGIKNNARCIAWPCFNRMEVELEAELNQGVSFASASWPEQRVHPQWSLVGDHVQNSSPLVQI